MINLEKVDNSLKFTFSGNSLYLQDGTIEVPLNTLTLVTDSSDLATFKKSATNDIFVCASYDELGMTKSELETWFKNNACSTGGGSITIDPTLDSGSTNAVANSAITTALNDKINSSRLDKFFMYELGWDNFNNRYTYYLYKPTTQQQFETNFYYLKINGYPAISSSTLTNLNLVETSAITTSVTSSSTDSQVPSAKAVYDQFGGLKLQQITQADYDALVQAGTVDASTLYIITNVVN